MGRFRRGCYELCYEVLALSILLEITSGKWRSKWESNPEILSNRKEFPNPSIKLYRYAGTDSGRQDAGTSIYERSRALIDTQPSSLRVRSTSARSISKARATPASPAAA